MEITVDTQNLINIEFYVNYKHIDYNLNIIWSPLEESSPVKEYKHAVTLLNLYNLGIEHKSNGESGVKSVSSNGIYAKFVTEDYSFKYYYNIYPIYRIKHPYRTDYFQLSFKILNIIGSFYWFSAFNGYRIEAEYPINKINIIYKNGQGEFLGSFKENYHSLGLKISL